MVNRSFKFRLYPSAAQQVALTDMLGAFCDLYNAGLQQRIEAYQRHGISLGFYAQASEMKAVRAADDRLARYSYSAEEQVLRRLDKAFKAFFGRARKGSRRPGFPRFRSAARFDTAEFRVGDGLTRRKSGRIGIVGLPGEVRVKWHRAIPEAATVKTAMISRKVGKWYICFSAEIENVEHPSRAESPIGVDVGLSSLIALSNGETVLTPQHTQQAAKTLCLARRALARCKRDSRRRAKAKRHVTKIHQKIAARRADFSHKLSKSLVDRFSHIAFENLNVAGLARGMLAKSVHNAAWSQLVQHVTYKAESAGSVVVLVDPRGTSQTCPECGVIERKTLAIRIHSCPCGCVLDRDVAAARVILRRADFRMERAVGRQASGLPHSLSEEIPAEPADRFTEGTQ